MKTAAMILLTKHTARKRRLLFVIIVLLSSFISAIFYLTLTLVHYFQHQSMRQEFFLCTSPMQHLLVVIIQLANFRRNFTDLPPFQTVLSIKDLPVHTHNTTHHQTTSIIAGIPTLFHVTWANSIKRQQSGIGFQEEVNK